MYFDWVYLEKTPLLNVLMHSPFPQLRPLICLLMFRAQTLSPYLKLGSKHIFLVCLIVEGQEWVAGITYRVSGGLSGQCCHWIIIGSAVLNWTSHGLVVIVLNPPSWLCWPLPVTPSYAAIALFCWGFLIAQVPWPPPPGPEIQPRPAGHPRPATVTIPTWPGSSLHGQN